MAPRKSSKKEEERPEESAEWPGRRPPMDAMFSKETQAHFLRAGSEMAMAMDSMFPTQGMPPEVREHAVKAKKEILLTVRALIDARIEACDRNEKGEGKGDRLRKIDVQ
ncbi:MAG TPA: hypothetical protein VMB46_04825 [Methanomassiliicoccales archaeon]|nr:hypothetical protein [Methanomassiliicoccales archaeon]